MFPSLPKKLSGEPISSGGSLGCVKKDNTLITGRSVENKDLFSFSPEGSERGPNSSEPLSLTAHPTPDEVSSGVGESSQMKFPPQTSSSGRIPWISSDLAEGPTSELCPAVS